MRSLTVLHPPPKGAPGTRRDVCAVFTMARPGSGHVGDRSCEVPTTHAPNMDAPCPCPRLPCVLLPPALATFPANAVRMAVEKAPRAFLRVDLNIVLSPTAPSGPGCSEQRARSPQRSRPPRSPCRMYGRSDRARHNVRAAPCMRNMALHGARHVARHARFPERKARGGCEPEGLWVSGIPPAAP